MRPVTFGASLLVVLSLTVFGQSDSTSADSAGPRWAATVELKSFDSITTVDALGRRNSNWYVFYTVSNQTHEVSDDAKRFFRELDQTEEFGQPIDLRLSVSLITDVPSGVQDKDLIQNSFLHCQLPEDLADITIEDAIQAEGGAERQRSADEIHNLYRKVADHNNALALHYNQVLRDGRRYFYSRSQYLSWFQQYREGHYPKVKRKLEQLLGRELQAGRDLLRVLETPKVETIGENTLEIRYEPVRLAPGESIECVAIFPDISRSADYIGVLFEGLADPIVQEDSLDSADGLTENVYVERKALLACYSRLGDDFERDRDQVEYLGKRWLVLERYPINFDVTNYREGTRNTPPAAWMSEAMEADKNTLRGKNANTVR